MRRAGAAFVISSASTASSLQLGGGRNPGAGIDSERHEVIRQQITSGAPGNEAFKDGYFHVACMNEGMAKWADLDTPQGEKRYAGENVNVTIVRYERMVPSEKREAMTPEVCYQTCRLVPDMEYFGLVNGRECYCAPYFKAEAGGEGEMCDAPCDGDSAQMCGGKTKADIYEMHKCTSTMAELGKVANETSALIDTVGWLSTHLSACGSNLQAAGDTLGKMDADSVVGGQAVKTKQSAGVYEALYTDSEKMLTSAKQSIATAASLTGGDVEASDVETVKAGEDVLAQLAKLTVDLQTAEHELEAAYHKCGVTGADIVSTPFPGEWFDDPAGHTNGTFPDYRNATLFAKAQINATADLTCEGTILGEVSYHPRVEDCADWCSFQGYPKKCVAFQHYGNGACVLFEAVTGLSYFTGCASQTFTCMMRISESKGFAFEKEQEYQKCPTV